MNARSWCCTIGVAVAVLISGCAAPMRKVTLSPNPAGVQVNVSSEMGIKVSPPESGLPYVLRFNRDPTKAPSAYTASFQLDGYEPATITIRKSSEQYDPKTVTMTKTADRTDFHIELRRELVREIPILVPKITPQGYTIESGTARAWVEDIEREAMGPSNIVRLAEGQSVFGMTISPDGSSLVFSLAEKVVDDRGNKKNVASMRAVQTKGGGMTQVTSGQWSDTSPTVTPDGNLLFCSDRLREKKTDIFRVAIGKTGAIAVIHQTAEGINYQPSVAPNGMIAYTYKPQYKNTSAGSDQVWTLGGENQYPTQLRDGSMPAVSPDGNEIAYIGPDGQLWKMPINGQNPVQLTSSAVQKEGRKHPAWSPDGHYILYASDEGRDKDNLPNYDIWMMREDGTAMRQLTTNGSTDDYPVASPDQKYVYFVSTRGFKEGIWRIPFPASDLGPAQGSKTAP